ncbi:hypothetical protein G6F70_002735 [Rhizopus microsporus]|uniref:HCP-like protein n=2 Tax=Rhizopus TaxID=4842 RepID=A0A367KF55_RHIAZ|nr:hypothetical protein G6F71_003895 [Rhizopus microsporus]RCI00846.1 hypothetical protein CU097_009108 [Rhizopus azygosporus]KAG1201916.1 hypothetical protein G6F70_002735 [Rhizopus microsporus]KAG1207536.1 hypothetical protein G6F69_007963 [Rhizopus microsporus]KAG1228333.1 hypothetical protein G6F67_007883 [Rhizopus microsporus]
MMMDQISVDRRSFIEENQEKIMQEYEYHRDRMFIQDQRKRNQQQPLYFDEYLGVYKHAVSKKRQSMKPLYSSPAVSTISLLSIHHDRPWPIPENVAQVHYLFKKARSIRDPSRQLSLCKTLMAIKTDNKELHQTIQLETQKLLKELSTGVLRVTEAQKLLASCFGVGGLGLPCDRERAFLLYLQGSKQNDPESNYRVGVCYELGIGTRRDYTRAVAFYRRAATLSHVAAMYKLSIILLKGYYQQVINVREGIAQLQRAVSLATEKIPHPLHALALLIISNEFSDHLICDTGYALELLHQAAKLNYLPSQAKLGELYETGKLVQQVDEAKSIYWYSRAAEGGSAEAALALSCWYLTGSSNILEQSDRQAYLWARKAASTANIDRWTLAKAYYLVGIYIEKGIGTVEEEDPQLWFQRSAILGHKGAMEKLKQEEHSSH